MIATFTARLRAAGCHTVFLGALDSESSKHLYARLGFCPVTIACAWVRRAQGAL
jgi:predicted GNAT family acetyltransferase